ncbi:inhibitor of growth protein 1-like [Carassius auratus]|uniref:Inhibitor of growth protein n=1 Tax=Carassius auratus TaxID=7957 RepID=A0A6P6N5I8_CARAU|nr:inhibitor of growth protein 1-like [Carassius auratus]XP_052461405.1 inhibitor of growth protein 1-like [Carassius gibelio]
MLNPSSNGESSHVVNYVEEYLELLESLPLDLQRCVSLMKEIDARYQEILNELDEAYEKHCQESDPVQRRRLLHCIQRSLIRTEELGDEKIQIAGQMVEMVENRSRQLDWQSELFQACQDSPESTVSVGSIPSANASITMTPVSASMLSVSKPSVDRRRDETPASVDKSGGKRSRRQKNGSESRENSNYGMEPNEEFGSGVSKEKKAKTSSTSAKKKKRSKSKQDREPSPTDLPIDPNEPTYCLCEQVSYGEMIGCDNDECTIEWFHFSCVGLHHKPKGKWYCPKCRGDNEKTMDKALERSKRERAYNR